MGYVSKFKKLLSGSAEARASSAYVICSVLQKCLSVITMPIFAHILTKEELGVSTIYSSTLALVIIFTTLNLAYGSFSPAMMKFEKDRAGYISSVNTICCMFTAIYFVVYLLFRGFWNDLADLPTELMLLMGFEMLFNTSIQFWMGKARFENKYKSFVFVTLLTSVLGTVCALLAVLFLPHRAEGKVLAYGAVVCTVGLVIMIISIVKGRQCFNKTYWKYALTFNIPLIPYYVSQIIFNQSDRLMIDRITGRGDAAMYGVAYSLAFILTFLLNAINNSFVPWMYRKLKEGKLQENKKISIMISGIMAFLLLGVIALAPELIMILSSPEYVDAAWVVPPVAVSLLLLFYSQLFINIEFYFEEKYRLVGASILAALVNIVLNYFGIKEFGYVAAGYTTLLSYVLFAVCNYVAMNKICRERGLKDKLYDYKALILILLLLMIFGGCFAALYPYRLIRFGVILVGMIGILVFHKRILSLVDAVRKKMKE